MAGDAGAGPSVPEPPRLSLRRDGIGQRGGPVSLFGGPNRAYRSRRVVLAVTTLNGLARFDGEGWTLLYPARSFAARGSCQRAVLYRAAASARSAMRRIMPRKITAWAG